MNNLKGVAFTNDGNMKRISITYDVVNENGKVVKANAKITRIVADADASAHIDGLQIYAQDIIDNI